MNSLAKEGRWVWKDKSLPKFKNWDKDQPQNVNKVDEDCTVILGTTGKWHDYPCKGINGFICEKRLTKPLPPTPKCKKG